MREVVSTIGGFAGGLFFGFLAAILAFIVISLVQEALESPKNFAFAALVLLSVFGTALAFLLIQVWDSRPMLLGALVSFVWLLLRGPK